MVEAVVVAAEKESRIILEIEKMEAERINNEREMMKSWEAHEVSIEKPPHSCHRYDSIAISS